MEPNIYEKIKILLIEMQNSVMRADINLHTKSTILEDTIKIWRILKSEIEDK